MFRPRISGIVTVFFALLVSGCQTSGDPNVLLPGAAPATVPAPQTGSYAVPNQYSGGGQASLSMVGDQYAAAEAPASHVQADPGVRTASFETAVGAGPGIPDDAMPANDLSPLAHASSAASESAVRPRLRTTSNVRLQSVSESDQPRETPDWNVTASQSTSEKPLPSTRPSAAEQEDLRWRSPAKW